MKMPSWMVVSTSQQSIQAPHTNTNAPDMVSCEQNEDDDDDDDDAKYENFEIIFRVKQLKPDSCTDCFTQSLPSKRSKIIVAKRNIRNW